MLLRKKLFDVNRGRWDTMAVATAERGTTHQKTSTKFEKQKHHSRLINLSLFL
jgi:hypothetical protein